MTMLMQASRQWSSRPADQRFTSLTELREHTKNVRDNSRSTVLTTRQIEAAPASADPTKGLTVHGPNGVADPTHWSFGQLAQLSGAPASYLRKLPAPLAADCINYGMKFNRDVEEVGVLVTRVGDTRSVTEQIVDGDVIPPSVQLRAATGPRYGRIWNDDIVASLIGKFGDGVTGDFKVPGEFGKDVPITRDNTTIYGSDRDMFVFLADEKNRIEMKDRRHGQPGSLARGFFVWNSEVGSQSMGAAFFLFDFVCMNRIVWGVQEFKEMRLRHSAGAPDRWMEEITPVLTEYANASAAPVEETIRIAQEKRVDDDLQKFLRGRFSASEAKAVEAAHIREEGRPIESLWDAVTGATAHAKTIPHQDTRVAFERKGGAMLDLVAAK